MFEIVGAKPNNVGSVTSDPEMVAELYRGLVGMFAVDQNPTVIMWQNLMTTDPNLQHTTAIGKVDVTDKIDAILAGLATRQSAQTDFRGIFAAENEKELREYARYLESVGICPPDSINNAYFVSTLTDFPQMFREVAAEAKRRGETIQIEPYRHAAEYYPLALENGCQMFGMGPGPSRDVAQKYYDKTAFRDLVQEVTRDIDPFFRYPRFCLGGPEFDFSAKGRVTALHKLEEVLDYGYRFSRPMDCRFPLLFKQITTSGGGFGNFVIYGHPDRSFSMSTHGGKEVTYADKHLLLDALMAEAALDRMELTPYLPIQSSHSWGVVVTDEAVVMLGRREQVLSPVRNDYEGFKINTDLHGLIDQEGRDREVQLCIRLGAKFHELGFRGAFSVDLFIYTDPSGELRLGVTEANMRRDATSFLTGVLLKNPDTRSDLLAGRISYRQDDHFHVPHEISSTAALIRALKHFDIPLASHASPYGVLLMTVPVMKEDGISAHAALAFLGKNDQARDFLRDQVQALFSIIERNGLQQALGGRPD